MGRIKDYYNELKETLKNERDEKKETKAAKNEITDSQLADEFRKEWDENKKDRIIMGFAMLGFLLLILLIIVLLYFIFNKPVKKMINDFSNKISVYIPDNDISCTNSFGATYIFNNEKIVFSADGSYNKYLDDNLVNSGQYNIENSVVTITISNENYQITYNITKDCSTITETTTGNVYQKQ